MGTHGDAEPAQFGQPCVECEDCETRMSSPPDSGKADGKGHGEPAEIIAQHLSKNVQPSGNGDVNDGGVGTGDVKIPPWTITLVSLIGSTEKESINIPQDVKLDVAYIAPDIKYVTATYATELLKQIAGLTAIAKQRSEEARDLLCKHRTHTEAILAHRMSGVMAIRRELSEFCNKESINHLEVARCPDVICSVVSRVCNTERVERQPDKHDGIKCSHPHGQKVLLDVDYKCHSTTDEKVHTPTANAGGNQHGKSGDTVAAVDMNVVCVESERHSRRYKRGQQPSVSLRGEDVIYGSWKMTKSA